MNENERLIFETAIKKYGDFAQMFMSIEEMGELIQALSKNFRGIENVNNIAEEIADVEIMIDQLKIIFGVEKEVEEFRTIKLERLKKRLKRSE